MLSANNQSDTQFYANISFSNYVQNGGDGIILYIFALIKS